MAESAKLVSKDKIELQITTNTESIPSKGEKKGKDKGSETPKPSAKEKWSYNEADDCEELEASDGFSYIFHSAKSKNPRKIYFSMKIKRFSDIDNVRESFRARYHLYLNWMITKKEYEGYLSYKREYQKKKSSVKWEPKFKPRIEFVNNVEEHFFESVEYPPDGCYRVLPHANWLSVEDCGFDCRKALFVRQKLECDYTFSEQMELRTFPFDCQDFTIITRESSGTKKAILMPEPRYTTSDRNHRSNFFKLDPTFSVLDEWDFYSVMLEVADSSSGASRSKSVYHEITVRFKLRRRWKVYLYNIIFYFMVITFLALTCFALNEDDQGERLNLAVTILLTLVAFQHTVFAKLPNIPYLTFLHKYIIISFAFVCLVTLESSFIKRGGELFDPEKNLHEKAPPFDVLASWIFGAFWLSYNIFFLFRAGWHRHQQQRKLLMDTDQIKENVDEKYPQFLMSWKSFRDIIKSGAVEEWEKQESAAFIERQNSAKEEMKKKENKKDAPKAVCVMEFGGARGEILTFASYAQKEIDVHFTFCGWISNACTKVFVSCFRCCCCACCREDEETNRTIDKKKSQAYDEAKLLQAGVNK